MAGVRVSAVTAVVSYDYGLLYYAGGLGFLVFSVLVHPITIKY